MQTFCSLHINVLTRCRESMHASKIFYTNGYFIEQEGRIKFIPWNDIDGCVKK